MKGLPEPPTGSQLPARVLRALQVLREAQLFTAQFQREFQEFLAEAGQIGTDLGNVRLSLSRPRWNADTREFFVGDELVKCLKRPAPNQEGILAAFEEEGWPPRIDDPLTGQPGVEPKRRLNETIKKLNRCQLKKLVEFHGDGSGEGIWWKLVKVPTPERPQATPDRPQAAPDRPQAAPDRPQRDRGTHRK